ncbi:hypothetical protein MM239_12290 [Belliella sp. DSM 111904]|uniref:Uncharacterized protein n=1 Tax=Belliella filtrata TaxID=2923435 RepID=A0ABS9V198_9BACT|nr:hypothetical protein [Belliella filtrata]MCH7410178.1 hypothetical protein [Belliella filtrata]
MGSIKDLIYFDFEKARSLISQLNGGLVSEISRAIENEGELKSNVGFNLFLKGGIEGRDKEKNIKVEKIDLYHELLNQIEKELQEKKLLIDINEYFMSAKGSFNDFIEKLPSFSFIKSNGWSQFEDFERFKNIFSNFNEIQRMVYSSGLLDNPEIKKIQEQISDERKNIQLMGDRNVKNKEFGKLKAYEKKFDELLKSHTEIGTLDEVFIERIKMFMDTFSPNRLNFRQIPFDDFNDFQILASLKEKYLVDSSLENIIYTYGTRPNIKLSVFGIITSCPRKEENRVDLSDEYLAFDDKELDEVKSFDKALRNVFKSFEEFEKFFFVPTYPKFAISPIAIYREVIYK